MSRVLDTFINYEPVPSPCEGQIQVSLQQSLPRKENTQGILKMDKAKAMGGLDMDDWDPGADKLLKVVDSQNLDGIRTLLAKGVSLNGYGGSFRETALHRAAQGRWTAGVEFLISAGASVYAKNQFGQTPLHYAAASRSTSCIKLLLASGRPGVVDHRDMRGHTPLHDAASSACVEAIALLLKAGALVRAKDGEGETPLHKAAKARSIPCMLALLNAGADLAVVNSDGESVLSYMLHQQPGAMDALFDHCLNTNSPKMNTKSLEVSMNFVPLTSSFEKNQVQNLKSFVDMGQAKLLCHPLCEMFLLLKWMKVRRLFLIEVVFFFMYAILTTVITFNKFVWTTTNVNESMNGTDWEDWWNDHQQDGPEVITAMNDTAEKVLKGFMLFQTVLILLQQIMSMLQNKMTWFHELSGILHVIITLLVLMVLPNTVPEEWQHHLATWLLLIIWTECMVLIGRFPNCGIYVAMFTRVARVFVRIFAIFFCLLVAFSTAFYVALHHKPANKPDEPGGMVFVNPLLTFTKTLTMMIGELDFGDEFVIGLNHLVFTGHFIFLIFVILVSIILSNLLVALAVNDVQGLRNSAHLERLIKQTELVFQMEKNFSTATYLASYIKVPKLQEMLGKVSFVCKHDCHNAKTFVHPNHPKKANMLFLLENKKMKEVPIPSGLLKNITECIRSREPVTQDTKRGTKRGSHKHRSGYQFKEQDTLKLSMKELETNVMDLVSEKVDEVLDSHKAYDKRLEEKLDKLMELLAQRNSVGEPPKASETQQPL